MDNTLPTSAPQPVPNAQPIQAPVAPVAQPVSQAPVPQPVQPTQPVQPVFQSTPVSGGHKEFAPIPTRTVEAPVSEYVKPAEVAPVLPQEVAEAGVEAVADNEHPQLDQTHAQVGVVHAPAAMQVTPNDAIAGLPYTYDQADKIQKATTIDDSQHWLVALTKYIIRKVQLQE